MVGWRLEWAFAYWWKENKLWFSKPFLRDVFQNVLRNTQLEVDRRWLESGPPYFPVNECIRLSLVSKWAVYGGKVVEGGKNNFPCSRGSWYLHSCQDFKCLLQGKWNTMGAKDVFSLKLRAAITLTLTFPSVQSLVYLCQDLTVKLPVSEIGLYPAKMTPATQQESLNTQVPA